MLILLLALFIHDSDICSSQESLIGPAASCTAKPPVPASLMVRIHQVRHPKNGDDVPLLLFPERTCPTYRPDVQDAIVNGLFYFQGGLKDQTNQVPFPLWSEDLKQCRTSPRNMSVLFCLKRDPRAGVDILRVLFMEPSRDRKIVREVHPVDRSSKWFILPLRARKISRPLPSPSLIIW